jgi:hypothetical protein
MDPSAQVATSPNWAPASAGVVLLLGQVLIPITEH